MITKKPDTEFDQLINAARHKYTLNSSKNPKFQRHNSPRDRGSKPSSANYAAFFAPPGANISHELANSRFTLEPTSPASNPFPGHQQPEPPGVKRWKHQGKTYKEEPIGKR